MLGIFGLTRFIHNRLKTNKTKHDIIKIKTFIFNIKRPSYIVINGYITYER